MAIAIAGGGTHFYAGSNANAGTGNITVTFGGGQNMPTPTANNVLVAFLAGLNNAVTSTGPGTIPAGWTQGGWATGDNGSGGGAWGTICTRVATGTESSYTFTDGFVNHAETKIIVIEFSGVSTTTILQATSTLNNNVSSTPSTTASYGSVTSTKANNRELHFAVFDGVSGGYSTEDASSTQICSNNATTSGFLVSGWGTSTLSNGGTASSHEVASAAGYWVYFSNILVFGAATATLTGGMSFSGGITRADKKSVSAAMSFVGNIAKATLKQLLGANLATTGSVLKRYTTAFFANFDPVGSNFKKTYKTLVGASLGLTGAFTRVLPTQIIFNANMRASALISSINGKWFAPTLNLVGNVSKGTARGLAANLSSVGSTVKMLPHALSAGLSFVGNKMAQAQKNFAATVSSSGVLGRFKTMFFTAGLALSGSISRSRTKIMTAAITAVGAISKSTQKGIAASISVAGSVSQFFNHLFHGQVKISTPIAVSCIVNTPMQS